MRAHKQFIYDLEGGEPDFGMLLDQLVHYQIVYCPGVGIRCPVVRREFHCQISDGRYVVALKCATRMGCSEHECRPYLYMDIYLLAYLFNFLQELFIERGGSRVRELLYEGSQLLTNGRIHRRSMIWVIQQIPIMWMLLADSANSNYVLIERNSKTCDVF